MKQALSFEQKRDLHDKVKDQNFRESARLEGIALDPQALPASPQLRAQLKATLIARYSNKATAIERA